MKLQNTYITILNGIYGKTTKRMDSRTKDFCLWLVFAVISIYFILLFSKLFLEGFLSTNAQREIALFIMLALATLFSMNGEIKPVKWNKYLSLFLLLSGAGLVIIGIIHPIGDGYVLFGILLLTVYPCFYLVWNNRKDYETLFDKIAGANVAVGSVYALYNLIKGRDKYLTRFFRLRFKGTTWNSNLYSMIGLTLFCCSVYLAYRNRKDIKKCLFYSITAAMGLIIVLLGKSRAAIIISILTIFEMVIYIVKSKIEISTERQKKLVLIGTMLVLCVICITIISGLVSDGTEVVDDSGQTAITERFSVKGKDLNDYTTGRIELWSVYAPMLNLFGNDVDAIDWDSLPVTKAAHCHNNFLEYGYRCGIPVSLIFLILELIACLIAFVYMFSKRCTRDAYLFSIIFTAMYFIDSLIDIATLPCERYAPFFFYLLLVIMIDPRLNAEREEKHTEKPRVIYKDSKNPVW